MTASSNSRDASRPATERPRFDRDRRVRTQRDFDAVFQGGRKLVNRQLVMWFRPAPDGRSRLGLSVSRRVGGAVQRNRVKRCLRAAFRQLAEQLPEPLDLVLIARPGQPPRDTASATEALRHLLRRLRRGSDDGDRRPARAGRGGRGRQPAGAQRSQGQGATAPPASASESPPTDAQDSGASQAQPGEPPAGPGGRA